MKLTAKSSGYYVVRLDGNVMSRHTAEREAIEAGARLLSRGVVEYSHDYVVRIEPEPATPDREVDTQVVTSTGTLIAGIGK